MSTKFKKQHNFPLIENLFYLKNSKENTLKSFYNFLTFNFHKLQVCDRIVKQIIILGLSLITFNSNVMGQVYFNNQDSLYYLDSLHEKIADGVTGYIPKRFYDDSTYILLDSVNLIFNKGNLLWKSNYDNSHGYQIIKIRFENNIIVDSIYNIVSRSYYNDGKEFRESIEKVTIIDGERNGNYFRYYKENPIHKYQIGSYKNVYLHGLITKFKDNGEPLSETMYKEGKINRLERIYFDNKNQLRYELSYINGLANGTLTEWWENGKVSGVTNYMDDEPNGERRIYLENGDLAFIQILKAGLATRTE